ncbi:24302_t:CDS:2 [Racocetra persica]|uniref:24302_t:CDS:1 n=1 Tax=Racocetra persica TaxID=160502 RepID=A0ACA9PAY1_9GLOM|nr:24302_t:CDS:2 [Racocetra persica]
MPLPYSKRKGYYQDRYKKKKEQTGVKSSPPDFTPQKFTPPTVTKIDQQLAKVITAALQQINQANTLFRQEIREHLLQQASSNAEVLKIVNQLGEKVNKLRQKPQTSQQLGQTKFGISWKLSPGGKKLLAAAIKQLEIETGISKVLVVVIVVGWGKKYLDKQKDSWGPLAGILGGMVKTEPKSKSLKSLKRNASAYYHCLADCCSKGECGNITKCTHHCKTKAPALAVQRAQEVKKFTDAYIQMGESAKNLFGFFFGNNGKGKTKSLR